MWDTVGHELHWLPAQEKADQLAISPDGRHIWVSTAGEKDFFVAFGPNEGAILREFGTDGPIRHFALSPSGSRILASHPGNGEGRIRLWSTTTGAPVLTLKSHGHPVTCVAFAPSGDMLASGDERGLIRLWERGLHHEDSC